MALKDHIGKGHLLSSLGFLATIPFHIPFRHSSPMVVDSVAIGCNRMISDEQTGRLVCVILPVEPLLDTQTG